MKRTRTDVSKKAIKYFKGPNVWGTKLQSARHRISIQPRKRKGLSVRRGRIQQIKGYLSQFFSSFRSVKNSPRHRDSTLYPTYRSKFNCRQTYGSRRFGGKPSASDIS